jgi:hypothetical protein
MRVTIFVLIVMSLAASLPALAQEQSRESMAVDATAAQWSFQLAYEGKHDYKTDSLDSGGYRPEGEKGFLQFRLVAPISKSESWPLTLLPRLTLKLVQSAEGNYGLGSSDVFALIILNQWASGRWGIGPQINFPAQSSETNEFGSTEWGYGFAAAVTQRALNDDLFLALLIQQVWRKQPDTGETKAAPLGLNPIIVYQLGSGFYISNGDYVINYSWQDGSWFVPFLLRFGKAFIGPTSTWNAYVEYGVPVIYKSWKGPVPSHILRINVQFQIPVG